MTTSIDSVKVMGDRVRVTLRHWNGVGAVERTDFDLHPETARETGLELTRAARTAARTAYERKATARNAARERAAQATREADRIDEELRSMCPVDAEVQELVEAGRRPGG